jgi:hypothetical protein
LCARRGDLEREAAQIYAKAFTEEELTAIADFYNSPARVRKLIENGPLVTRELLKSADIWSVRESVATWPRTSTRCIQEDQVGERPKVSNDKVTLYS